MTNSIEDFTETDFSRAFAALALTAKQVEMLRVHLAAPGATVSARQLARAVGFANWHGANLHYGRLAGRVCRALGIQPTTNLAVLVEFFKAPDEEYQWRLRPAAIGALKRMPEFESDGMPHGEEVPMGVELSEGASYTVRVSTFERNPVARTKCVEHYGPQCVVCGFIFSETYGAAAQSYVQVHHLVPLASIRSTYVVDPIKDLRPVCPNCHAVIHLRTPPYSIEEVKCMLTGNVDA